MSCARQFFSGIRKPERSVVFLVDVSPIGRVDFPVGVNNLDLPVQKGRFGFHFPQTEPIGFPAFANSSELFVNKGRFPLKGHHAIPECE